MPPDAKAPARRPRVRARQAPSSTARQNAAFGSRPARALPKPAPRPAPRTPSYHPTPTPDQVQGRPSEPVKVTVRARHQGGKIVRHTTTLPNVAHAQAHLDRVQLGHDLRARARKAYEQAAPIAHRPALAQITTPKQQRIDRQVAADADRKIRATVRAQVRTQRRRDERDIDLAGAARSSPRGRKQFRQGIKREAEKVAPEVTRAARRLPAAEQEEFHGAAVHAARTAGRRPASFTQRLQNEPADSANAIGALVTEAEKRDKVQATKKRLEEGDVSDVVGNAKRFVTSLKDAPAGIVEAGRALGENAPVIKKIGDAAGAPGKAVALAADAAQRISGADTKRKPHTKALVAGELKTAPGELAQAAVSAARGRGTRGHLKKAGRAAALDPVGTALTVVPAVGSVAKGAEAVSIAGRIAAAGKAGRSAKTIARAVQVERAARRVRPNLVVDASRTTASRTSTRVARKAARGKQAVQRKGQVATKAQTYSPSPIARTAQKAGENVRVLRGQDPFQARGRRARRVVNKSVVQRIAVKRKAGDINEQQARLGVTDEQAQGGGRPVRETRRVEKRALRGTVRVATTKVKAERAARAQLFAKVQQGIVKDAKTLDQHINMVRSHIRTGMADGKKLTPDAITAAKQNLTELEHAKRLGLVNDPNILSAAEHRKDVSAGPERRRESRIEGGAERMRGRLEKVIAHGRQPELRGAQEDVAAAVDPAAATHAEPLGRRGRGPDDPGVTFKGDTTPMLREQADRLEKKIAEIEARHHGERPNADTPGWEPTRVSKRWDIDPDTGAPLRKHLTPREKQFNAAENKARAAARRRKGGKPRVNQPYKRAPYTVAHSLHHEGHRPWETKIPGVHYGYNDLDQMRADVARLRERIATREQRLNAIAEGAVERPGGPGSGAHRVLTADERREVQDANQEHAHVQGLQARLNAWAQFQGAEKDAAHSVHTTTRAHNRHNHMVYGHPLDPADSFEPHTKEGRLWGQHDRYAPLLKTRADWEQWTSRYPPGPIDAGHIADSAHDLLAARRAGTGGPREPGSMDHLLDELDEQAAVRRRLADVQAKLNGAEADLERLQQSRIAGSEYEATGGSAGGQGGEAVETESARRAVRARSRRAFERDRHQLEEHIDSLREERGQLANRVGQVRDFDGVGDEELRGVANGARQLHELGHAFREDQRDRQTTMREEGRKLSYYGGLQRNAAEHFRALDDGTHSDMDPTRLQERLDAARARKRAADKLGRIEYRHVDDQTAQALHNEALAEEAGASMRGKRSGEVSLEDERLLRTGRGRGEATGGLTFQSGQLRSEQRRARVAVRAARPKLDVGPGGGPTEGLGAARAALARDMPEAQPVGEHVGLPRISPKSDRPIPVRTRRPRPTPRLMPKPKPKASAPPKPPLTPYRRTLLELRLRELTGQAPPEAPGALPDQIAALRPKPSDLTYRGGRGRPPTRPVGDRMLSDWGRPAAEQPTDLAPPARTPSPLKARVARMVADRASRPAPVPRPRLYQGGRTSTPTRPVRMRGKPAPRAGSYADVQPPKPPPTPQPTGPRGKIPDRGSYVPTERELGQIDPRLGVGDINGRWSRTDLLTNPWGRFDPAETAHRLEAGISADSVRREILQSAHRGKTDLTADEAAARVKELNANKTGIRWAAVETKDGEGTHAVLPRAVADAWKRSQTKPGLFSQSLRYANTRFVRAALPLAANWHAGNAVDMMTRLALSGARPGDAHLADELRRHLAGHDEDWARQVVDSVQGAHFASYSGERPKVIAHIPKVGARLDTLLSAGGALDKMFAAAKKAESKGAKSAQGTALRQQAAAMGHDLRDLDTLAKHYRDRPELVDDFHRRTLEIVGDYLNAPTLRGRDLRAVAPFMQWIKASLKFTFATLPAKHPVKTALLMNLAQATQEQRRQLGEDSRVGKEAAKTLGLPAPHEGFLGGGVTLPGGRVAPTSNLTSFGSAAGLVDDPTQFVGNIMFPWLAGPAGRALGSRDSAVEYGARIPVRLARGETNPLAPGAGRDTGRPGSQRALGEALDSAAQAFLPPYKQVAKARSGARRPGVHTTAAGSIRYGKSKTKPVKAVLGGKVLEEGKFRDHTTGRTYPWWAALMGPDVAAQKDFPSKRPKPALGPGGTIVPVTDLDGSTFYIDTRTGNEVRPPKGAKVGAPGR